MSIKPYSRPLLTGDHYYPDQYGARRYEVENTEANIDFVRNLHNQKLHPYLIDFDTLEILEVKSVGMRGIIEKVAVQIRYNDPDGKPHEQKFPFERHNLQAVLSRLLTIQHWWYLLPCDEHHPFGILLALEELGVKLSMEDVSLSFDEPTLVQLEAKPNSLGWFGEIHLRLI